MFYIQALTLVFLLAGVSAISLSRLANQTLLPDLKTVVKGLKLEPVSGVREMAKAELAWINDIGSHGLVPRDHDPVWWTLSLQVF